MNCVAAGLWGATPLYRAVFKRHLAVVRSLLDAGADPNIACRLTGKTPIDLCDGSDPTTREILRLLEIYSKRFLPEPVAAVGDAQQMVRTESRPVLPIRGRRSSAAEMAALEERASPPAPAVELV